MTQGQGILAVIIALLFLFASCGCGATVKIEGIRDVTVTHEVSIANIEPYIVAYCAFTNPKASTEEVEECAKAEIGRLLGKL